MDQGALAIERVLLVEDMDRVKRTVESDRLRSALLTSISHDLKTPLASVLGAASTMRDLDSGLTDAQKRDLLATVIDEIRAAEPVSSPICSTLTKLESGAIVPQYRAARYRRDRRQRACGAPARFWCGTRCRWSSAADLPMLELDAVLFEQVLFNLLDNAAKYAPAGTTISIRERGIEDPIALQIIDEGGGIPPAELESVFDKFYRAQKGDHVRPGTGLGLAISRGFVEAMHGTISAANRTDRSGAVLTIRLPIPAASDALDTAA